MHLADLGGTEGFHRGGHDCDPGARPVYLPGGFRFRPLGALDNLKLIYNMQSQWFVIHTLSGQEQKVKDSIEKRIKAEEMTEFIKEVLVPMERVAEVRGGQKTVNT